MDFIFRFLSKLVMLAGLEKTDDLGGGYAGTRGIVAEETLKVA